jgi:hypothetical protein
MNNSSFRTSLREWAAARTRSGDVSPEPPPFLKFKRRWVREVSSRPGCGPCWKHVSDMTPARAAINPVTHCQQR